MNQPIPQFGLYGEAPLTPEPGYVHVEDIETRSSESGWIIQPHRHGHLFQVLCMEKGEAAIEIDDHRSSVSGRCCITIPAGVVHGFRFASGTKGVVLTVAEPLLLDESFNASRAYFTPLITAPQAIRFDAKDRQADVLFQQLELIRSELQYTQLGQSQMQEWLVRSVLLILRRQLDKNADSIIGTHNKHQQILRFRALLDEHFSSHWTVKEYARAMNISVATLNRLCNHYSNQPAKVFIQNRLLLEARRRLLYTQNNLDQIAYSLGFKDPGYFSRFFKNQSGMTPSAYRHCNP